MGAIRILHVAADEVETARGWRRRPVEVEMTPGSRRSPVADRIDRYADRHAEVLFCLLVHCAFQCCGSHVLDGLPCRSSSIVVSHVQVPWYSYVHVRCDNRERCVPSYDNRNIQYLPGVVFLHLASSRPPYWRDQRPV